MNMKIYHQFAANTAQAASYKFLMPTLQLAYVFHNDLLMCKGTITFTTSTTHRQSSLTTCTTVDRKLLPCDENCDLAPHLALNVSKPRRPICNHTDP